MPTSIQYQDTYILTNHNYRGKRRVEERGSGFSPVSSLLLLLSFFRFVGDSNPGLSGTAEGGRKRRGRGTKSKLRQFHALQCKLKNMIEITNIAYLKLS
jgi:hypothetical protein